MTPNRRKETRHTLDLSAKLLCGPGAPPRDCLVTDISDGGVRLSAESIQVPDEFVLLLNGENDGRECRVTWRLGREIGAEFVGGKRPGFAQRLTGE